MMDAGLTPTAHRAAQDLTKAAGFALGPLSVDPPARQVSAGARSAMLEPRVMRVLVALGGAEGKVLSRDDLIEQCWDGTVVGDKAIDRAIALLRHALDDLTGGAVRLETITKVGFRLVAESHEQTANGVPRPPVDVASPVWRWKPTRRAAAGGIVAIGLGAALGYAAWNRAAPYKPDPRAVDLYNRGQILVKSGEIGAVRQAMDFYKQAVTIDPDYADAWGALAVGYIQNLDGLGPRARVAAPGLSGSAAQRALSLDPDQPDAQLALAMPFPHFRRWLEHEQRLRDVVRRHPDYWYGHAQLGLLLQDVGRIGEAVERFQRTLEIDPMVPNYWARLAVALQNSGRDQEADVVLDEALARWPTNNYLRVNRASLYLASKRYAEAAAFQRDPRDRPEGTSQEHIERNARMADALASGIGLEQQVNLVRRDLANANGVELANTATILLWLGAVSLAFDALEAAYFGGNVDGRRIPPPGAADRRPTMHLFSTSALAVRDNPRFASLLERTGLEDYWRKSGTQPDFRRA